MYSQSRQSDKSPKPSLPFDPPKIRVKSSDVGFARQNTEKPVNRGKIHSGNISHTNILGLILSEYECERYVLGLTRKRLYKTNEVSSWIGTHP